MNDIDFDELNKIGEDWEREGRVSDGVAGNAGEPGTGEVTGEATGEAS